MSQNEFECTFISLKLFNFMIFDFGIFSHLLCLFVEFQDHESFEDLTSLDTGIISVLAHSAHIMTDPLPLLADINHHSNV